MIHGQHATQPELHGEALLLPLADDDDWPNAPVLEIGGTKLRRKSEFHVTLLGRTQLSTLRERLGDARILQLANGFDWQLQRTGEGSVLAKCKPMGTASVACTSVIERLHMPVFSAFRHALSEAADVPIADALPHVTLYVAGDPDGIGLPDLASFAATRQFDLPLPGNIDRPPPALTSNLHEAYLAADYRIGEAASQLRIGHPCPQLDPEFARHGARRALLITACNPFSIPLATAANALRQQFLQSEFDTNGITTLAAAGHDPEGRWPAEPSLLALGTLPDYDDALLLRHQQHAAVVIEPGQPALLLWHPAHRA